MPRKAIKLQHPLFEVFGFPYDDLSASATRSRTNRLCPFNNKSPNCTKDKAQSPLGVCSMDAGGGAVITCPVRFRQDWMVAIESAGFFFRKGTQWTSLTEVKLKDKNGGSAGNIDVVLVAYDDRGQITDFGSLEIQAVYISGNIRRPFEEYMKDPAGNTNMPWTRTANFPTPDFLSSSRKRLVPQLLYKGGILKEWGKKQAVAIQRCFYETLPDLPVTSQKKADIAWLLYDLERSAKGTINLVRHKTIYTEFLPAMNKMTIPEAGELGDFMNILQEKLDEKLNENPPDAPALNDILLQ